MSANAETHQENWTEVIEPSTGLLDLRLKEVWRYRDLLLLLVKRDFVATYKQTILGPIWFFLQPLLTTVMFVVLGSIANIDTDGLPRILFCLAGVTIWNYFAECLNKTSTVFRDNASIFGKVYFPRLIMPLSIITSNLVKFGIQFVLFIAFWIYFIIKPGSNVHPNGYVLLAPLLVIMMAFLGLGFGLLISAMTNKYKDLVFLLTFAVQLAMYATPIIYPISAVGVKYQWLLRLNPMTSIVETFRYGFLGNGTMNVGNLLYSFVFSLVMLALGAVIFNKVEKGFMDTV